MAAAPGQKAVALRLERAQAMAVGPEDVGEHAGVADVALGAGGGSHAGRPAASELGRHATRSGRSMLRRFAATHPPIR